MLSCGDSGLDIRVTKTNVGRALRFMDSLLKGLEAAGHSVALQNGRTYVTLGTDTFHMQLREQTTKAHSASGRVGFTQYQTTGKLAFSVGIGHMREFRDGMRTLEEQLPVIMEHFEVVNQEWLALRRSQRIREDAKKEQERIVQEAEDRRKKEASDFKALLEKAERWHKSDTLRRYIDEVERRGSGSGGEDLQPWLEWARKLADCMIRLQGRMMNCRGNQVPSLFLNLFTCQTHHFHDQFQFSRTKRSAAFMYIAIAPP